MFVFDHKIASEYGFSKHGYSKKRYSHIWPRVPQRRIDYHCMWGQLSTSCSNTTGAGFTKVLAVALANGDRIHHDGCSG